jgi:hypothetical protein
MTDRARWAAAWAMMLAAMLIAVRTPPPSGIALDAHFHAYLLIAGLAFIACGLMETLRHRRVGILQAGAVAAATWLPLSA